MKSSSSLLSLRRLLLTLMIIPALWGLPDSEAAALRRKKEPVAEKTEKSKEESKAEVLKPPAPARASQVVVLAYHRFVDNVRRPDTEITVKEFEEQMQQLKDAGIEVISMDDFLAWKRGEKQIPERSALITFDDGWRSQITKAWPVLKKFDYPFTLFIYTDYVKGGPRSGGESMSWADLEALRDAGVAIESHTVSHSDLRGKRSERGSPEYHEWLKKELEESRGMLEQRLGIRVRALAVPYGYYNSTVQEAAEKAGYEALFTVRGESIQSGSPNIDIGRYIIHGQSPEIFEMALTAIGAEAEDALPAVAELTGIALTPGPDETIKETRPAIKASLKSFGSFDPESLTLRLSGAGVLKGEHDRKAGTYSAQPAEDLPPGRYTVIVSATENGQRKEGRWEFTIAGAEPDTSGAESTPEPAAGKAEQDGTEPEKGADSLGGDTP